MCDEYNERQKKYFKTEDEFKLDRIRNYFTPIKTYFELRKMLEDKKLSEDQKNLLKNKLVNLKSNAIKVLIKLMGFWKQKNNFSTIILKKGWFVKRLWKII